MLVWPLMPEPLAVVTGVRGLIVEIDWIASPPARVFARLISGSGMGVTVAHRGNGVRGLVVADREDHGLLVGTELSESPDSSLVALTHEQLESVARGLDSAAIAPTRRIATGIIATGIKVLDVMCPLVDGGTTWLIGGHDVGRMKFLEELHARLAGGPHSQTVVFPIVPEYAASVPQSLAEQTDFPPDLDGGVRSIWLISEAANHPTLAERAVLGSTRLVFDPGIPARGYWPAVDVLASRSSARIEPELVERIMALAHWTAQARASPSGSADPTRMAMARRLERYFAQPFRSAQSLTGLPGTHVPIDVALESCRAILEGREPRDGYDFPESARA